MYCKTYARSPLTRLFSNTKQSSRMGCLPYAYSKNSGIIFVVRRNTLNIRYPTELRISIEVLQTIYSRGGRGGGG